MRGLSSSETSASSRCYAPLHLFRTAPNPTDAAKTSHSSRCYAAEALVARFETEPGVASLLKTGMEAPRASSRGGLELYFVTLARRQGQPECFFSQGPTVSNCQQRLSLSGRLLQGSVFEG